MTEKKLLVGKVENLSGDTSNIHGWVSSELHGDASNISGDIGCLLGVLHPELRGDTSDVVGDITGISGDVSNFCGDVTGLVGNVDLGFLQRAPNSNGKTSVLSIVKENV